MMKKTSLLLLPLAVLLLTACEYDISVKVDEKTSQSEAAETKTETAETEEQPPFTEHKDQEAMFGDKMPEKTSEVTIYLVALEDDGKTGKKIGCGDSLIPVIRTLAKPAAKNAKELVTAALTELFSIKDHNYGQSGLYHSLADSDLKVEKVITASSELNVYLTGTFALVGTCEDPRMQEQIKETIKKQSLGMEYKIFYNGSEENWRKLFDMRG